MSDPLKLRPFIKHMDRGSERPMIEVRGRISGSRFIIDAIGLEIPLDTLSIAEDARGPYALVSESEQDLPNGFRLEVSAEPDEILPTGAEVCISFPGPARERAREALRAKGIDPDSVLLAVPHESAFAVHFNSDGGVSGQSGAIPGRVQKPTMN